MEPASHDRIAWLDQGPGHQLFRVEAGLAYRFLPTADDDTRLGQSERLADLCDAMAQGREFFPARHPSPDNPDDPLTLEIAEPIGHRLSVLEGRASVDVACAVGEALLGALTPLHDAGLFHGALTPRRVLWRTVGGLLIMDTGGGVFAATPGPLRVNTPAFADLYHMTALVPPELLTGGELGQASDVYLVAGLVAQWLTGRPLYRHRTSLDTYRAITRGARSPLVQMDLGLPESLKGCIDQALTGDPGARPSPTELREALAAHGDPMALAHHQWPGESTPWWPRERTERAPEDAPSAPGSEREHGRLQRLQQASFVLEGTRRGARKISPAFGRALTILVLSALVFGALALSRWTPPMPDAATVEDRVRVDEMDDGTTPPEDLDVQRVR